MRTRFLPGSRGRWVRQGSRILLLPDRSTSAWAGELEGEVPGGPPQTTPAAEYTVCDFIHPRIDVEAQYALFGLLRRGPGPRAAALAMLAAVRAGDAVPPPPGALRGIFQEDQREPALRARDQLKMGWWDLVKRFRRTPQQLAVCVPGTQPLIAFSRSVAKDHAQLGTELAAAWGICALPALPAPPPSGRSCTRPPPKKADPPPVKRTDRPELDVHPGALSFHAAVGSTAPLSDTIQVRNSGPGAVAWQANVTAPWLDLSPSFGSATLAGNAARVIVSPAGLAAGTYRGQVVITSPDAANSPRLVDVTLTVGAPRPVGPCGPLKLVDAGRIAGGAGLTRAFPAGQGIEFLFRNPTGFFSQVAITLRSGGRQTVRKVPLDPRSSAATGFSIFGKRPIRWDLDISVAQGGAVIDYSICSDWAKGDPPDP